MIVQSPDGKTIDFGNLAPDQVTAAMQKMYPPSQQESLGSDVGKSIATGLGEGAVGMVTGPIDLGAMAGGYLAKKALGDSTLGITSDSVIGHGLESFFGNGEPENMPNLTNSLNKAVGIDYQPETTTGKYAQTISSFVPAIASIPTGAETVAGKAQEILKRAAFTGGGSELGGELTNGTSYAPYGRIVGALAGGATIPLANMAGSSLANASQDMATGFKATSPEDLKSISNNNFLQSGQIYKKMRDAGAVLNQDASNNISSSIDQALAKNPFIPQLNPKTIGIVEHLKDSINQNGSIGLDELDQYRRLLSRIGGSEDGFSAGEVKKAIDASVNGLEQSDLANGSREAISLLNQARSSYSHASRFEDVANIIQNAAGDPNKIKMGLSRFMNNPDNLLGWTSEQKLALSNAANTGVGENVLKALGKFGLDFSKTGTGNTVLPALAAVGGHAGIIPGGVPLAIGGTIARQGQKYLARGKAQSLLDAIQQGIGQ